ncbi:MAG: molybdenum cofactor synthesis domain-containing protein [Planctomycetota bacterium]|jgi:molybdenum cofactor synthesis domain-containing protein
MPTVQAICISDAKGERKTPVESAIFRADYGIESDAHAGQWHRQVSLLAAEDVETIRRKGATDLSDGDFAENVIVSGLAVDSFGLGTRLRLGKDVVLALTQIGKVCHTRCQIFYQTGDCIMPRLGMFARVESGGAVRVGDSVEVLDVVPRELFQVVVLTISDRCSRGEAEDTAGPAVVGSLCQSLDAHIYRTEILPDERDRIAERLTHYCDGHSIDLVVTVGGTGFAPRDMTPEASRDVIERLTPGLDEAMRAASLAKTPHAILSRSVSGIRGSTLIINLPGSQRAAVENLEAVLGALQHGLQKLRGDQADCGRPRTDTQDAG